MYSALPNDPPQHPDENPDEPAFIALLRYLSGPRQAHEEAAWAQLARVIFAECRDPWDDGELRRVLQARGRTTHVVRTAPAFLRPAALQSAAVLP